MDLTRREALHRLTLIAGGVVSAPAIDAIFSGLRAEPPSPDWIPGTLTRGQADLLAVLVDRIIPPTDTPGAKDAGVHVFIDRLLGEWVEPEERARFQSGLAAVDQEMMRIHAVAFGEATAEQQNTLLTRLDDEAARARAADADPLPFFATLKEWTLVGYYTSQAGATQELQWLAAPGRYDADLPLQEVGRTWA